MATRLRTWPLASLALLLLTPVSARSQDFGRLLKDAARDTIRRELGEGRPSTIPGAAPAGAPAAIASETYSVRTFDGWNLVAHRYRPAGAPGAGAMPVILCHGLTYNAQFWDLDPSVSFARYLAQAGYDVWAVDLRGCGSSQKWTYRLDEAPEAVIGGALRRATRGKIGGDSFQTVDPKYANWTLDDHIAYDVPALVKLVQFHTKAPQVAWVGHSMGGIVALGHLARYKNPGIGRLVTIGSQVTMNNGQLVLPLLEQMMVNREQQLAGKLTGDALLRVTRTSVHNLFFNVENVSPQVYQALGSWATDVPALGLMRQYTTLASRGVLLDVQGQFNYAQAVPNINVPILIACGAQDQFAPPTVQKYLFDHVGSTEKQLVIFGRGQGLSVDAGHDDALVGLNSAQEVYPVIEAWLAGAPR